MNSIHTNEESDQSDESFPRLLIPLGGDYVIVAPEAANNIFTLASSHKEFRCPRTGWISLDFVPRKERHPTHQPGFVGIVFGATRRPHFASQIICFPRPHPHPVRTRAPSLTETLNPVGLRRRLISAHPTFEKASDLNHGLKVYRWGRNIRCKAHPARTLKKIPRLTRAI